MLLASGDVTMFINLSLSEPSISSDQPGLSLFFGYSLTMELHQPPEK